MGTHELVSRASDKHARRRTVIASVLVQAGFVLACSAPGERAAMVMGDGSAPCLPGETCSSLAPRGLLFRSAAGGLFGGAPVATAVGGKQTVYVQTNGEGSLAGASLATTVEPAGATATLRSPDTSLTDPAFEFAPSVAGSFVVSVRESRTRALLDRTALQSVVPTSLELRTAGGLAPRPFGTVWRGVDVLVEGRGYNVGVSGARELAADEQWSLMSDDPSALTVSGRSIRGLRDGLASLRVRIGVTTFSTTVDVVSVVDSIRVSRIQSDAAVPSPWSPGSDVLRVEALRGGRLVLGAPIAAEPSYPDLLAQSEIPQELFALYGPGFYLQLRPGTTRSARLPITFRSGAAELRGEVVIEPSE